MQGVNVEKVVLLLLTMFNSSDALEDMRHDDEVEEFWRLDLENTRH